MSTTNKPVYNFISKSDSDLICNICSDVCTLPKQCEDCGKLFCSECIEKNKSKPCPNCKKDNPRYFKDVKSAREIKELKVRCANVERSCQWIGNIGTLKEHESICQFALVSCPNKCGSKGTREIQIMRKDMDDHLKTKCLKRSFKCPHCGDVGTFASISGDHIKICKKKIVPCPQKGRGCPLLMEQGKVHDHVRNFCDYTEIACAYENLRCGVRMPRKDIKKHERKDDKTHLHLVLKRFSLFKEEQKIPSEGKAFVFKLPGYTSKRDNDVRIYSKPFYTSVGGYKMCIGVDVNGRGEGKGTHMSFSTELLEGHYDDQLNWPFLGSVRLELLNQLVDDNHHEYEAKYTSRLDTRVGNSGLGCTKFFPHSSLSYDPATNTQYLLDDTLYFRVSVKVDSHHKPWLVCTDTDSNIGTLL